MFYITAIALYPALLALVVPIGLALVSLAAGRAEDEGEVRTALAPIVGLAALSVVISLLLHLRAPASTLVPAAVALNLAAFVWLGRAGGLRFKPRLLAILLLTGWLAYLVLTAPLLMAGRFGVLGYQVNNDTIFHSIMPEYLNSHGYDFPVATKDAFTDAAVDKFVRQGYPDGWHQVLLLAMRLFGRRAYALFNFVEAFYAALVAPVGYAWLRRARVASGWALLGGFIAAVGYIQLSYLFQGFAPQVAIVPFIYACLFLFYLVLIEGRRRWAALAALLLQVSLAVYSFTILIWLAVFVLILLAYRLWLIRSLLGLKVELIATAAIGIAAVAINPFTFLGTAAAFKMVTGWSAADSMGNLVSREVPILPVLGIWPTGDHRGVPAGWLHPGAYLGAAIVIAIILVGLKARSGRPLLWMLCAAMAAPAVALKFGASPYYFAKTVHIAGPAAAIVFAAGSSFIWASGRRGRAALIICLYLVGLAGSDLVAARFTSLTPDKQFAELLRIDERFAGQKGLTLFIETNGDWGDYLLGDLLPVVPFALAYRGTAASVVRPLSVSQGVNDLDSLKGIIGQEYSLIVIAKGQDKSLPPPRFVSVFSGDYYNAYQARPGPGRSDTLGHRPFETAAGASYLELRPGEAQSFTLRGGFKSLLVSAYLAGDGTGPVTFSMNRLLTKVEMGRAPAVYALSLAADSSAALRVRNTAPYPLRLDWMERLRRPHDQAALFRYNDKNKRVFRSASKNGK